MRIPSLLLLLCSLVWQASGYANAYRITQADLQRLLRTPAEATVTLSLVAANSKTDTLTGTWRRIEVYAPSARIWVVEREGPREVARDARMHFISVGRQRMGLSIDPHTRVATGVAFHDGKAYAWSGEPDASGLRIHAQDTEEKDASGHALPFQCAGQGDMRVPRSRSQDLATLAVAAAKTATRQAVVAVDTDNEWLQLKFSDNTSAATAFIAGLFTALNVIYEDDAVANGLQLRLVQGDVFLRPSTTADPYASTSATGISTQLNEFSEYWRVNQGGVSRAFAMQLSGKLAAGQAGGGSGIAWILGGGSYCGATGFNFGAQTFGHYSVNRISTLPSSPPSSATYLVAHELGHNFGAEHTHCADATTGAQASTNTIDQCYAGESGFGCYGGATACPSSGPGAPAGTLMSYCHLRSPSCGVVNEFHPTHVTQLNQRIASQPTNCITALATANQSPAVSAPVSYSGSEDATLGLTAINFSDPDAAQNPVVAAFSVATGGVYADAAAGVAIGTNPNARTLTGSLADINALISLNRLRYVPATNANGAVTLSISINDQGHVGTGGVQIATHNATLNLAAVNDAPTLVVPMALTLAAGQALPLGGIAVADVDAGASPVTVVFSAPQGSFTATAAGGVGVSGSGSGSMALSGSVAALNAFLAEPSQVQYVAPSIAGTAFYDLTVQLSDNGHTGGGALSVARVVPVAVNDALFGNGYE